MPISRARIAAFSCLLMVACTIAIAVSGTATATPGDRSAGTRVHAVEGAAGSARAATYRIRLRKAVASIPVAAERSRGYDRDKFRHWVDANSDCQDTRDEVLAAESKVAVTGCDISTGRWVSYYDRETWTSSSDVDIDHLVPLAEAWASGARGWNASTRQRYANDLGDKRSLVAVTDNVNQSKSDQDPAEWLPEYGVCTYVRQWTAVKLRWSLRANRAERAELVALARDCTNKRITVKTAKVVKPSGGSTGGGGVDPRFELLLPGGGGRLRPLPPGSGPGVRLVHRQRQRRRRLRVAGPRPGPTVGAVGEDGRGGQIPWSSSACRPAPGSVRRSPSRRLPRPAPGPRSAPAGTPWWSHPPAPARPSAPSCGRSTGC